MADPWAQFQDAVPSADQWSQFKNAGAPQAVAQPQPITPPNNYDYLAAGPGGAATQGAVRSSQGGLIQLPMHLLASATDLFGTLPNPVSGVARAATNAVDEWITKQNQGYEGARDKFTNPANRGFEAAGAIPAGMIIGNLAGAPQAAQTTMGNVAANAKTGGMSGGMMGAMNPVLGDAARDNYWGEKFKQTALGALVGGITGGVVGAGAPKPQAPPSTLDIKAQANDMYKAADQAGVIVKNDSLKNFSDNLQKHIAEEGLSKRLHPGALGALQDIEDAATSGQPITLKGIDLLRQNVGDVAATAGTPGERRLAGIMRDKMDDYLQSIDSNHVITGDPQSATQVLSQARDVWSTYKKSALIDDLIDGAKNRSNFTASGYENGLRTEFRALAQNNDKMRQFSPDERDAIHKIVRGGPIDNFFRGAGRFVSRGPVSAGLTVGATALGGPVAGAGVAAGAEGARWAATRGTLNNIESLQNLIKGYTPQSPVLPPPGPGIAGNPAILRLLQSGLINSAIPPLLQLPQQIRR